jgi:uncharacterized protein (TIGR02271 family)
MSQTEEIVVIDAEGQTARVRAFDSTAAKTVLRYGERQVIVPTTLLVLQEDGSYRIPLSLAALEEGTAEILVLPVVAEEVTLQKRRVETGRVRVSTTIEAEQVNIDELLHSEEVEVQRIPVNRPLAEPLDVRFEGDTIIVPVMEEVLQVSKQLILLEEVHITKRRRHVQDNREVTLRRQKVQVDRLNGEDFSSSA